MQSLPHGNVKQWRVSASFAYHSHAGQGDGDHANNQGKAGEIWDSQDKAKGLYSGLDNAEQMNKDWCGGQAGMQHQPERLDRPEVERKVGR